MNKRKIQMILFILFIIAIDVSLFADEQKKEIIVTINSIETIIDGSTIRRYLLEEMDLEENMPFESYQSMISFLDDKIQDLLNMRVFEEAEYSLSEASETELEYDYNLIITIKDSWNIFPFPYPKYTTNDGFKLGLKFFYYNMFGTLRDFKLTTNINLAPDEINGDWEIPSWTIAPSISGVSIGNFDFSLTLSQEYNTEKIYKSGELQQKYTWDSTSFTMDTTVALPRNFYYSFGPSLSFDYGIKEVEGLPSSGEEISKNFSNLSWSHSIGYNNINWIGNLREGFASDISNKLTASADLDQSMTYTARMGTETSYFWYINNHFNFSTRFIGMWSNHQMLGLGSNLRGLLDGYMYGYLGGFLSLDMNISVIDWDKVGEVQIRPFFDIGIVDKRDEPFDLENDFAYTTGADFVLYLDKIKSLQARATIGINLSQYEWSDSAKYGLDISSSLSY
jgi:hypothetical protein